MIRKTLYEWCKENKKTHEPEVDYKKDIKQIILEMKSKNQTDDDY